MLTIIIALFIYFVVRNVAVKASYKEHKKLVDRICIGIAGYMIICACVLPLGGYEIEQESFNLEENANGEYLNVQDDTYYYSVYCAEFRENCLKSASLNDDLQISVEDSDTCVLKIITKTPNKSIWCLNLFGATEEYVFCVPADTVDIC